MERNVTYYNRALYLKNKISIFDTKYYTYIMNWKTFSGIAGDLVMNLQYGATLFGIDVEVDERLEDGEIWLGVKAAEEWEFSIGGNRIG